MVENEQTNQLDAVSCCTFVGPERAAAKVSNTDSTSEDAEIIGGQKPSLRMAQPVGEPSLINQTNSQLELSKGFITFIAEKKMTPPIKSVSLAFQVQSCQSCKSEKHGIPTRS